MLYFFHCCRNKAQKALWFAETYGLTLKSLHMEDNTGRPINVDLNSGNWHTICNMTNNLINFKVIRPDLKPSFPELKYGFSLWLPYGCLCFPSPSTPPIPKFQSIYCGLFSLYSKWHSFTTRARNNEASYLLLPWEQLTVFMPHFANFGTISTCRERQ